MGKQPAWNHYYLLVLCTICSALSGLSGGQDMRKKDLKSHGVLLIVPGETEFAGAVGIAVGAKSSDLSQSLQSISVVLRNQSNQHIVGYALEWEFVDPSGKSSFKHATFVQPASLSDKGKSKQYKDIPSSITIAPTEARIVSPIGSFGVNTATAFLKDARVLRVADDINLLKGKSSVVNVVLDGVLFEDGSFFGPDKRGFFESVVKMFDVTQRFHKELTSMFERGASEKEIVTWVASQKRQGSAVTDPADVEVNAAAEEFLRLQEAYGLDAAIRVEGTKTFGMRPAFVNKGE
jgi:hypothetical protein